MKTLNIEEVSQKKTKYGQMINIVANGDKYKFFDTKKDGSKTKAWEQWQKYGYGVGDTVEAEVDEKEKQFKNDEGTVIDYMDRRIMYFGEVEGQPTTTPNKKVKVSGRAFAKVVNKIGELDSRLEEVEKFVEHEKGLPKEEKSDFDKISEQIEDEADDIDPDDIPF